MAGKCLQALAYSIQTVRGKNGYDIQTMLRGVPYGNAVRLFTGVS